MLKWVPVTDLAGRHLDDALHGVELPLLSEDTTPVPSREEESGKIAWRRRAAIARVRCGKRMPSKYYD
jgi:hypothetical protein